MSVAFANSRSGETSFSRKYASRSLEGDLRSLTSTPGLEARLGSFNRPGSLSASTRCAAHTPPEPRPPPDGHIAPYAPGIPAPLRAALGRHREGTAPLRGEAVGELL